MKQLLIFGLIALCLMGCTSNGYNPHYIISHPIEEDASTPEEETSIPR